MRAPAQEALLPKRPSHSCCSLRTLRICVCDFAYLLIRMAIWLIGHLLGYRDYEPEPGTVVLCCHTNGMGHVIQMLRIFEVLSTAKIKVDLVVLADQSKIPEHFLIALREKAGPKCEIVDLQHEVAYYDNNGGGINNLSVVMEAVWKIFGPDGWRTTKQCTQLLMRHRPEVCLSLWDPHLPLMVDSLGARTHVVQVATQAIMYEHGRGHDLVLDMLYLLNVSRRGELLPLLFSPQPGAMPIVCEVPPLLPSEPYLVAYSCMPQVLTPLQKIKTHKILLFAKNVDKWARFYADCPNVHVHPVGSSFKQTLAKSSGLIASPSPGAVIQALGCAKPCYLFIPPGHLEQICNYQYYTKHFIGVHSPETSDIVQWADGALSPSDTQLMLSQAYRVRDWLNLFDDVAQRTLVRSLKRQHQHGEQPWPPAAFPPPGGVSGRMYTTSPV